MAHILSFELRTDFQDFRERIGGMLVGVSSQCAKGFQFADCTQPPPDRWTIALAPSLDRKGQVRCPKEWSRDQSEYRVKAVVQQVHQSPQLTDLMRGKFAMRSELTLEMLKFG